MNILITVKNRAKIHEKARELQERGFEVICVLSLFGTIAARGDPEKLVGIKGIKFRPAKKVRAQ